MPTQTASLVATTITDNPAGYDLKLSTNSEYNCLKTTTVANCNGSYNISPVLGTNADPSTSLSVLNANQWGVTLTSSFTGTDKGDDVVWFQIPNKNNAVIIATNSDATTTTGDITTVTFGAKVDYSIPPANSSDPYQATVVV
ncbi:MAG: hypothetical protein LBE03_01500, partial [Candidatus Nomurabacteria bacterium]|nr:hypothetical protein [Candidatus Nomurabacteria bacterium]